MAATSDDLLMTPEEAAHYLRVNLQTVYRLLRNCDLPGVKVGRQWRIKRSDLEACLKDQRGMLARAKVSASDPTGAGDLSDPA